ncbi:MAG: hypothetical protein DA408_12875 [Bacteroidetes bacterium]|nr:MAG: hypothetical protein C7N36_04365 [Bacteroidota bacterium]PTM11719.1 MAG: hypothetical protein DA408_12875 [Bacteroidota bacterium]
MNLRTQLLFTHSKVNTQRIAAWIGQDAERFSELVTILLHDEVRVVQRAAWVLSEVGCAQPSLLEPHWNDLITALEAARHPAVPRNIFKVIADAHIYLPEDLEGRLVQACFVVLAQPQTPVAVQVHAMGCLANRLLRYPDLAVELKAVLEEGMAYASAGYRSRAQKVLKQIARMG